VGKGTEVVFGRTSSLVRELLPKTSSVPLVSPCERLPIDETIRRGVEQVVGKAVLWLNVLFDDFSRPARQPVELRPYTNADRDRLLEILRLNVPKYFSHDDVLDFEQYLHDKPWTKHYVYLNWDRRIVGCASCYARAPGVVGLCWMFFEPFQVGPASLRPMLEEYCARVAGELCPGENATLALNTTPRTARFMRRLGFATIKTIKDGYAPGYDKVLMERRAHASGAPLSSNTKE
jgi:[ribosomal protein S18]-alanine N-acetyltransferase